MDDRLAADTLAKHLDMADKTFLALKGLVLK